VVVVVAWDEVDGVVEEPPAVGEGQVDEALEHHGGHVFDRQGQLEDVAAEDEGGPGGLVLVPGDQLA